jgi:hypothetical protein
VIDGRFQLVGIPQRDHHPWTRKLCQTLLDGGEVDKILLYDNETRTRNGLKWLRSLETHDVIEVRYQHGNGVIYEMWNGMWQAGLEIGEREGVTVDVTICNNDIRVPRSLLGHLSRGLRSPSTPDGVWITYPDWQRPLSKGVDVKGIQPTAGTWRKKGMSGFCFMMKPEKHYEGWPFIDERFKWLAGDGDLCSEMQARGATAARVVGLPIDYDVRGTSHDSRNKSWVEPMARRDMRFQRKKWARGTKHEWDKKWRDVGLIPIDGQEPA